MNRIEGVILNVPDPEGLATFYTHYLGMTLSVQNEEYYLTFQGGTTALILRQSLTTGAYRHHPDDRYWKIGVTLPDIDFAYSQLTERGIVVSEPYQFQDIGYLCHLSDPNGFQIELLQHTFENRAKTQRSNPTLALGGRANLAHITLRSSNIDVDRELFETQYKMRLLSRQAVADYGFELYFWAFTAETPPHSDIKSVKNREWLWQRPYTVLEIQHKFPPAHISAPPTSGQIGYGGVKILSDCSPSKLG